MPEIGGVIVINKMCHSMNGYRAEWASNTCLHRHPPSRTLHSRLDSCSCQPSHCLRTRSWLPLVRRYLVTWCVLVHLTSSTMSAPTDTPRWVNPCGFSNVLPGSSATSSPRLFKRVMNRARTANLHATEVKNYFVENEFPDSDFERGVADSTTGWLPDDLIPPASRDIFNSMSSEDAFKQAFKMMQYFAVGIEQLVLDQTLKGGRYLSEFQEVENNLSQLLCELQLGMRILNVSPDNNVLRDVMSQDYRYIRDDSRRNVRDYLILREYIRATNFVYQLFQNFYSYPSRS